MFFTAPALNTLISAAWTEAAQPHSPSPAMAAASHFSARVAPWLMASPGARRRSSSSNEAAAHHADLVAGDVRRGVGGEEQACVGDLLRPAEAAEWNLLELLRQIGRAHV